MWLLFIVFAAAASGQRNDIIASTHLDLAMSGFDAFCVNSLTQPDPGRRSKILQPIQTPITTLADEVIVNKFIHDEEAAICFPNFLVRTVINYIELRKYATSSAYQLSSDLSDGSSSIRYDNSASCKTRKHDRDRDLLQFFKDTGGEVILVSAECVTRVIDISPFQPLTFTPEFETALVNLYKAASNPASEISDQTFSNFVWSYGTHFSKRTHLGAKAVFGKLFSSRSATRREQTTRRRCVLEAAKETLMSCTRWCNETTLTRFQKASSVRCLEKEQDVLAAITGPLPKGSLENWVSDAEELPDPIYHYLEPITSLFQREWMSSHPETRRVDKAILRSYFRNKLEDRTNRMMTGGFGQSQIKGCGLNSRCDPGRECFNEPDTESGHRCQPKDASDVKPSPASTTVASRPATATAAPLPATTTAALRHPGWIIIAGGVKVGETPSIPYSMTMFGPTVNFFPVLVHGNSLSMVDDTVYSCGGYGSSNSFKKCWAIDTGTEVGGGWRPFDIPWELGYHSAVVVQDDIWFFLFSMLRIFHTKNQALKFREFQMEFSFGKVTCAVAHGSKTFVIGVGDGKMEVYVNTDHSKPDQWKKFSKLLQGRETFGCHVFREEIFVTGGYEERTYTHLSSVEAISVVDGTVRSISPMGGVRADHKMAIIEGRLSVLGGYDGTAGLATIETYDEENNSWKTLGRTLGEPRFHFGLTQYLP